LRYIGSKISLLKNIDLFIRKNIPKQSANSFFDAFSGTGSVGYYFKDRYKIYSCDNLYFSYLLQKCLIQSNKQPDFSRLNKEIKTDPFNYFNNICKGASGPVFHNFSHMGKEGRKYFSKENGKKIDFILRELGRWKKDNLLSSEEVDYIKGCLIYHLPSFSNIGGTYGAFLKQWDKRALKPIKFYPLPYKNNKKINKSYFDNLMNIIHEINADILYLDPPYNARQYAPNYHVLETIALEDFKNLKGVTGLRDYTNQKSDFCNKNKAKQSLSKILNKTKSKYVVMSYSSDGIVSKNDILDIFKNSLQSDSVVLEEIPYRKFKRTKNDSNDSLYEYLIFGKK
tara:strand:+ start:617 stop:1636 length:1020 start_codon:yes stop_codon:yes gene_type:complete